jgi:hypothetical protein
MDDVLYGCVCNNVVIVSYLSEAGFITRGLFSNNPRFVKPSNLVYNNHFKFECYEFFRNKKVIIEDQTKILEASFQSPEGVRAGQIVYGECQPTKNFITDVMDNFPEIKLPFERGNIKSVSLESKNNAIAFFTGSELEFSEGQADEILDDLICSEIFIKVPLEEMFLDFLSKGDSENQWRKIINLYCELSINEVKSDNSIKVSQKENLIKIIEKSKDIKIDNLSSLKNASWPRQLMPRPNWFSFET